ncbi:MAG: ABC transporter permease [Actinomycetota bacterium]|nr:ABC transporter permease [Actinomycetota bacterium]
MSAVAPAVARPRLTRATLGLVGIVVLAAAWQLLAVALNKPVFPTFTTSFSAAIKVIDSPVLGTDIVPSVERTLLGFALSTVIGVAAGMLIGRIRKVHDYTSAVIDFMRALPTPLLVPAAMVIFGLNGRMVVATIVSAAVWPVLINTVNATSSIDATMIDTAVTYGLRGKSLFMRVILPAASPQIFAGMRVALSVSLAVMVVAEMLGGGSGIGYFISNAQQSFNIDGSYGGVVILGALGWGFDTLFLLLEHWLLSWQRATSGGAANA